MSSIDTSRPVSSAPTYGGETPASLSTAGLDLAAQVMAIRSATRGETEENVRGRMNDSAEDRRSRVEARLEALTDAAEARESAGLWGEIGGIIKAVAVAVSAVVGVAGAAFTGGASAVAAVAVIAALTAASVALPYVAREVGEALGASPETMMWIQLGVAVACTVMSMMNPGASATSVSNLVTSAAQIAAGGAKVVEAKYDLDAGQADASAERNRAGQLQAQFAVDAAIDQMEDVMDDALRTSRSVRSLAETQQRTQEAALRA